MRGYLFAAGLLGLAAILPTPAPAFDYPSNGTPSRIACIEWMVEHPEFEPLFDNLPPICFWHYVGWDCEQTWTPAGWLRPGGYCEQRKTLLSSGSGGQRHREPEPCYPYPDGPYGRAAIAAESYCPE